MKVKKRLLLYRIYGSAAASTVGEAEEQAFAVDPCLADA